MKIILSFLLVKSLACAEIAVPISEPVYLHISEIFPAQLRYSSQNVQEKINKKITQGHAWWNSEKAQWQYRYDSGRSIFSIRKAIPVVKAPFGHVLTDGHHNVLASLALGAAWIPVKVIADMRELSESEFWDACEKIGLAYLYDLQGVRRTPPRKFDLLEDDPNRYFAAISARKCSAEGDLLNSAGAEYPLWIKAGKDTPFIEFKIADILWQHQIIYSYDMGKNPPEDFVEKARRVLSAAKVPGLQIIAERKHYSELVIRKEHPFSVDYQPPKDNAHSF